MNENTTRCTTCGTRGPSDAEHTATECREMQAERAHKRTGDW